MEYKVESTSPVCDGLKCVYWLNDACIWCFRVSPKLVGCVYLYIHAVLESALCKFIVMRYRNQIPPVWCVHMYVLWEYLSFVVPDPTHSHWLSLHVPCMGTVLEILYANHHSFTHVVSYVHTTCRLTTALLRENQTPSHAQMKAPAPIPWRLRTWHSTLLMLWKVYATMLCMTMVILKDCGRYLHYNMYDWEYGW